MPPHGSPLFDGRLWILTGRRERWCCTEAQDVGQSQELGGGGWIWATRWESPGNPGDRSHSDSHWLPHGVSAESSVPRTPTCAPFCEPLHTPGKPVTDEETEPQSSD